MAYLAYVFYTYGNNDAWCPQSLLKHTLMMHLRKNDIVFNTSVEIS